MKKALKFENIYANYLDLVNERSDFESEWRLISDYLVPGRGCYQLFSKPQKRTLTSKKVINTTGEDALYVLTSGIHGALTSPSRPWFRLEWADDKLQSIEPLVAWLQSGQEVLQKALQVSNFYSVIDSFYVEYGAFGTAAMYTGEDSWETGIPFRHELLTVGEYAMATNAANLVDKFFRTIFMTPRKLVQRFGKRVSPEVRKMVEENRPSSDKNHIVVLEAVLPIEYQDKPFTQIFYEVGSVGTANQQQAKDRKPLAIAGFYEMPYHVARWSTIGSDVYGVGPGERALPDIRRLQEMEKAFLMAAHKSINPPLNVPAWMKGKVNTLPGGMNYYRNPNETVNELYRVQFDFAGASAAIERVEERIKRNFFNDIFLLPGRGPDKSPLKATEVTAREQEKMLRLGPVVERLQHEFLQPLLQRCFNILLRNGFMEPPPEQFKDMLQEAGIEVVLISPMATAQRTAALQGLDHFMAWVANAAQFDQEVLDNIDIDAAAREVADVNGVSLGILRPQQAVDNIRKQRQAAMAAEKKKQEQMQMLQMQSEMQKNQAEARKTSAEAGQVLTEAQQQLM